jgi:anti-anti-sigma factor
MEINIKNDGAGNIVAELSGRLDANSSPQLQQVFDEMGESLQKADVTLEFSALDYVSSAGLRVLLIIQKKVLAAQGSLTIRNINNLVREVFDMTGFSNILKIV